MTTATVTAPELNGSPAGAASASTITTVEVEVDGKKFSVPAEVAKGITDARAAEQAANTKATETAAREAELRKTLEKAPKQPAKDGAADPNDLETLLFTDPKKAAQLIKEQAKAEMRDEMAITNAQTAFWNSFYEKNDDLKDADIVVKALFAKEFEAMRPLSLEKARDHLAEVAKKELLRLGVTPKGKKQANPAEGGTERKEGRQSKGTEDSESSPAAAGGLTSVLQERRNARREARTAGKAASN